MGKRLVVPEECREWLNDETLAALLRIGEPGEDGRRVDHATKKMLTTMLVAWSLECDVSLERVFEREDTCARSIWFDKWKWTPTIVTALEACRKRIQVWRLQETASKEAYYADQRHKAIAEFSADAPVVLADVMSDRGQKGDTRINAAMKLIGLAEPEAEPGLYTPVGGGSETTMEQQVKVVIPDNGREDRTEG